MDFKNMLKHRWQVWFNHGEGQAYVYAPDAVTAEREAKAWCLKHKTLVDRHLFDNIIAKIKQVD